MVKKEDPGFSKSRLFNESIETFCRPPPIEKYKGASSHSPPEKKLPLPWYTFIFKIVLPFLLVALLFGGFYKFAWPFIKPTTSQSCVYLRSPCPDFVGREKYLDTLRKELIIKWEPSTICIKGLWGKGGFGKTELANEFANRFRNHFSLIWTFSCDNDESIKQGYQGLAKQFGLYNPTDSSQKTQEKVHFYLENGAFNKPWLLIFDNVEDKLPEHPQRGGAILVTSQQKVLNPNYLIEIQAFTKEESLQLLEKITHEKRNSQMEMLILNLEKIPLLINYAAHYIKSTPGCSAKDYQSLFCSHLHEKEGPLWKEYDVNRRYLKTLASSWKFTLESLKRENPAALEWLLVCSYLYSENIPEIWIDDWLALHPIYSCSKSQFRRKEILKSLQNFGIIQFSDQTRTFSLHRFFQYMIRESRHKETQEDLYKAYHLLSKYNKIYNFFSVISWEAAQYWYLHTSEFTKWMDKFPEYFSDAASLQKKIDLFSALGRWNLFNYRFSAALDYFHQAIDLCKSFGNKALPTRALGYFSSCLGIGYSHYKLGQYRQALNFLHQFENEFFKCRDEQPLELSTLYVVKGLCHEELKEHETALLCYQKSLEINRHYPGEQMVEGLFTFDTITFCSLGNMGQTLIHLGRYKEALDIFNQALPLGEKTVKKNHPFYLMYAIERAHSILLLGNHKKALKMMQDSMNEFKTLYPMQSGILDQFGELGFSWCALGNAYYYLNNPRKAKEMFRRARRCGIKYLGKKSFIVIRSYQGLGLAYLKNKNVKKGLKYLMRRLQLYAEYEVTSENMRSLLQEFQNSLTEAFQIEGSALYVQKVSQEAALLSERVLGKEHILTKYFQQFPSTIDNSKVKI